jgi:hypothetical protein
MRKLIGFDDDTFDKLTQLGRGRMATLQELAEEARRADRPEGCASQKRRRCEEGRTQIKGWQAMTPDPDPFEEGQRAARENIPAKANPYQDGSDEHALWSAGHEQIAGEAEANESEAN